MQKNPEPRTQNRDEYTYRNLILWQKAQELTLAIIRIVAKLPDDRVVRIITGQIVRCSSSVGANIAEGHGRFSLAAHANYLSIAKASACETDNFLDLLRRAGYITAATEAKLHSDCTEVVRMLTAKILNLGRLQKAHAKSPRLGDEVAIYRTNDYTHEGPVLGSKF